MANKYKAIKTVVDGIKFDSKKEAARYIKLKADEAQGVISDLQLQVRYELIPKQELIKPRKGKSSYHYCEPSVSYIADFVYRDFAGNLIVEDVKGMPSRTTEYKIKRKLMLYIHGIQISEV